MGGPGRRPGQALKRALLGATIAAVAAVALAADGDPPIRAMHWLAPGADPARALGSEPTECLSPPRDPERALSVEVGRAAFRTPVLLGGQAARAGLACETCHRAGRSNPDFHFPGVSGPPGTADVTDSLFSAHRGDGVFNPKPIPDLAGPKSALKIDQGRENRALERFIHGLVAEEFDGPEPPPAVLSGVADYVRALSPAACPAAARRPLEPTLWMADARRAVVAARTLAARGDRPAAILMLAAARARLGMIDERYPGAGQARLRRRLRNVSLDLAQAQTQLRGEGPTADAALAAWLAGAPPLEAELRAAQSGSLFNPRRLAKLARRRLPT